MRKLIFISLTAVMLMIGCNSKEETPKNPTRTVIAYFIADNNLYDNALADINEMESAWDDSFDGNMLVLLNGTGGTNILYHIRKGTDPAVIESDIVKVYSTGSQVCSKDFLNQVVSDAMKMYPASSYALDLWSHGRSWIPANQRSPLTVYSLPDNPSKFFYGNKKPPVSDFGADNYNEESFEVYDLADALSTFKFDFVLMDACHMGSIECAYQFRNICDFYIASAAETLVDGAPYDQILPDMFAQPANTVGIAEKFYNYYNALSGSSKTATISVVESDRLENVAAELDKIVTSSPYVPFSNIQQYGRTITHMNDCLFDLEDFVIQTWGEHKSEMFSDALSKAVIYKASTPEILAEIPVNHFSGLSNYIPKETQPNTYSSFKLYDWATDSGLTKMIE